MLVAAAALFLILLFSASQAKIGYFWHITDIHYDPWYSTNGDPRANCWRNEVDRAGAPRSPGRMGDYDCDAPWALVESAVRAMKSKHGENIEFILWTGDGASHASATTPERQLAAMSNITALLRQSFSSQFVFPVLGHEDAAHAYANLSHLWRHWLPPEAQHTFEKGGYYTIEQKFNKLRLILINTNLYTGPSHNVPEDPADQLAWLEKTLSHSQKDRETVYIVGHVPPGPDEPLSSVTSVMPPHRSVFLERFNTRYLHLVRKFSTVIVGQFFGHLHADCFRIVYDSKGFPVSWMMVAPAVSPRRSHGVGTNPGLRLYKFDTETGQVLDYAQYYLDLQSAGALREHQSVADLWQLEYNLTTYYGLREVSPGSLASLAASFTDPARNYLATKYDRASSVRHGAHGSCDASCAHAHYCAATKLVHGAFRACMDAAASSLTSGGVSAPPIPHGAYVVVATSVGLLVVLGGAAVAS